MITGIRLKASPTKQQKAILSQWMGCARFIWNAKCATDKAQRVLLAQEGQFPPVNQTYTQYKNKATTPWLYHCPSVILRNSVSNWYKTYRNFFKKRCGRPRHKHKDGSGSIYLTRELFAFIKGEDGVTRLFIGGKKHALGHLVIKNHRSYRLPGSIYIKKQHSDYWVSFCYEDTQKTPATHTPQQQLQSLRKKGEAYLAKHTIGIDRGVVRPLQCSNQTTAYDLTPGEKVNKAYLEKRKLHYQKKLSRQQKGSNRRYHTKIKLARHHRCIAGIRNNFCHQVSRKIVDQPTTRVIVLEDLGIKRMTRRPKPKQDAYGNYLPNRAKAKAGLNRGILDKCWHKLATYLTYKAHQLDKVVYKVAPNHTSQECAHCHHIHPHNRKSQHTFCCTRCGHTANADLNAARVIQWRAIQLILNSGTELSARGVLSLADMGRGANVRRKQALG